MDWKNTILMKLRQKTLKSVKCALKLCLEAIKVVFVGVFLISRTWLFLNITAIINLEQFSILSVFSKKKFRSFISFLISDLVRTIFTLYWFPIFFGISVTLKITFNQTLILFQKLCNFHINQIKGRLVKRQLKMLGVVQKNWLFTI